MTPLLALSSTYQPPDYPGEMWLDAVGGLWNEVSLRGYSLGPLRVPASTPRHVVVMYKGGSTNMRRSIRGSLIDERVVPGDLSIKSVQNDGGWSWDRPLDVLHLYIDPGWLDSVAAEIHGPGLARIDLRDSVKTRDDELAWLLSSLEKEAADKLCGARLMIPLLQRQVGVALIRNYATLERHDTTRTRLSSEQTRIVHEYIAEHLDGDLKVEWLARRIGLSTDHFSRLFRATFDCAPHSHVMRMRIELASRLLSSTPLTVADIACKTGFADQSHLTRRFRREYGLSPSQWRSRN